MKYAFMTLLLITILFAPAQAKDSRLVRQLKRETRGLTWVSETDSPVRVVRRDKAFLLKLERGDGPTVPHLSVRELFEGQYADWSVENDRRVTRFRRLYRTLILNLRDLRVYYTGREPEYVVYVLGRTKRGGVVGLRVLVVSS